MLALAPAPVVAGTGLIVTGIGVNVARTTTLLCVLTGFAVP